MMQGIGSIVKARGREWVVLPGSSEEIVHVQPLGGNPHEVTAILPAVEEIAPATFKIGPEVLATPGDYNSAWLLRAAARIGNQNTTGPFRSLGKIRVEPRPYQYVPLLLALRNEPVRLMIADDVGIGKTVESLLIARELLDRGEIERICVLCPPHLADQWVEEMKSKFHLDATPYLAKTSARIHRNIPPGEGLFDHHPIVVASIDYVKQKGVRHDTFVRNAPEFIIVDEAHGCTTADGTGQHLRYELIQSLAKDPDRHLLFVTATPHSGKEDAFRRLMTLLNPALDDLPDDLHGDHRRKHRDRLANHLVQRRRQDLARYLEEQTPFPEYIPFEGNYTLHKDAMALLEDMVAHFDGRFGRARSKKDVRSSYWSMLSLLRAFASSPAALAATLEARSFVADAETEDQVDRLGEKMLLDDDDDDDGTRGARLDDPAFDGWDKRATDLLGAKDLKLQNAKKKIKELLADGRSPIVFCQFIETADYLQQHLEKLGGAEVRAVTGRMQPSDRINVVEELGKHEKRILVATDCLSEGINLQEQFDSVFHYDLAWNPTRHEQRDGRVDRFNQPKKSVVSYTYYGRDNRIDGVVLRVLLEKHTRIRSSTGVSVPVPQEGRDVAAAIMEAIFLKEGKRRTLSDFGVEIDTLHTRWQARAEANAGQATLFAHRTIKDQEVQEEIESARLALAREDVEEFFVRAMNALGAGVTKRGAKDDPYLEVGVGLMDPDVRLSLGIDEDFQASFHFHPGRIHLHRTHPIVQNLCDFVLQSAIDDLFESPARRCGASIGDVEALTNVFVLRFRYKLRMKEKDRLVEDVVLLGERDGTWIPEEDLLQLLKKDATGTMDDDSKRAYVRDAMSVFEDNQARLIEIADERCAQALRVHQHVRDAGDLKLGRLDMKSLGAPDLLGAYVFVPKAVV